MCRKRIILREPTPDDIDFMLEVENEPLSRLYSGDPSPCTREMLESYLDGHPGDPFQEGQLRLTACLAETKERVGLLDFFDISMLHSHATVGIAVHKEYRHRGLGEEIIKEGTEYAEKILMVTNLLALVAEGNTPALRMFQACGFREQGRLPHWWRTGPDTLSDCLVLTRELRTSS